MLLREVFDSYMTVSGTDRSAAYTDRLMFAAMDKFFGPKAVNEISPHDLSKYLSMKRGEKVKRNGELRSLQPATLNKHTQFLRRLINHAEALGEPVKQFRWKAFTVIEPEQQTGYLTVPEEHIALTDMDDYIRPIFLFSVLSGIRLANAIGLKKSMVDWETRRITFKGKSRRPGGKTYIVPLTSQLEGILEKEWNNHDEYVFTFKARKNSRWGYREGHRYPITRPIIREYWERLRLDKRWHDLRHTFGTRLYQETRDIHLVQRAMNHSDVNTTMRYVHTDLSDVQEAMERLHNKVANLHHQEQTRNELDQEFSNVINLVRSKGLEPSRLASLPPQDHGSQSLTGVCWHTTFPVPPFHY